MVCYTCGQCGHWSPNCWMNNKKRNRSSNEGDSEFTRSVKQHLTTTTNTLAFGQAAQITRFTVSHFLKSTTDFKADTAVAAPVSTLIIEITRHEQAIQSVSKAISITLKKFDEDGITQQQRIDLTSVHSTLELIKSELQKKLDDFHVKKLEMEISLTDAIDEFDYLLKREKPEHLSNEAWNCLKGHMEIYVEENKEKLSKDLFHLHFSSLSSSYSSSSK